MQQSLAPAVLAAPRRGHAARQILSRSRQPTLSARRACVTVCAASAKPLIKVCGVTTVEEGRQAAEAGASMVGLILWPKSKRSVDLSTAKEIAAAIQEAGAKPVAIFVDEDAKKIAEVLDMTGIEIAQLHGDGARAALATLPAKYKAIWVLNADANGKIVTKTPAELAEPAENPLAGPNGMSAGRRVVDYLLVDGVTPGSGVTYDYSKLKISRGMSRKGWLLAGGLDAQNVGAAMKACQPDGVDVSSGVTCPDGVKKARADLQLLFTSWNCHSTDPKRVVEFIAAARAGAMTAA